MASWMVHLRVSDALLERYPRLCATEFTVGNIAPDSGVPNADWSTFTPDTKTSHFKVPDQTGKLAVAPDLFASKYFTDQQIKGYTENQLSFYLGYYVHLLTDVQWVNEIVAESIERDREAYLADPSSAVWKWKRDWYDLDYLYLRDHPGFSAFEIYASAEGFRNDYMDEFSLDAFDNRRAYITDFYRKVQGNLDREYPFLSRERMDIFVASTAKLIEKTLFSRLSEKGIL